MPRPIWNGSISFGLVSIPVKLMRAQSPKDVSFHQLHEPDGARIQQKRWCSEEDKEVPYQEIVKGYELGPDKYVLIDQSELAQLDPVATQTIDISDFVDLDEIDPIYFERTYHLTPADKGSKPYALLARAMEEANKVAIAKFVMRTKEYLCALRPMNGALVLETMYYADEIVSLEDLEFDVEAVSEPKKKEVDMAMALIDSLSGEFDPTQYTDKYREKVLDLIDAKAEGEEFVAPKVEEKAPVLDLMAALEASLKKSEEKEKAAKREAKKPKKRAHG